MLSKSNFWKCITILSDHFIGISQAVVNSAPSNIKPFRKSLVYNAFDANERFNKQNSRDLINRKFPICKNAYVFGYVGRLVDYKNVDFLIKCLPKLMNSTDKSIYLLIAGHGLEQHVTYLKNIVNKLNLQSNIIFTGFVSNPLELISGLDVLVASSGIDAFGRTVIESMLQSTPVLAANRGGHSEIIDDEIDGLLYNINCENDFIEKALRLLEDYSLRDRLTYNALKKSSSQYTQRKLLLSIEDIYKSVKNLETAS
ncbi:MAG: hypothetical protein CMD35_04605 [Flavobacteriales bacterium]|nr:hypothetical protein [Flavobacteriales bacterium]